MCWWRWWKLLRWKRINYNFSWNKSSVSVSVSGAGENSQYTINLLYVAQKLRRVRLAICKCLCVYQYLLSEKFATPAHFLSLLLGPAPRFTILTRLQTERRGVKDRWMDRCRSMSTIHVIELSAVAFVVVVVVVAVVKNRAELASRSV